MLKLYKKILLMAVLLAALPLTVPAALAAGDTTDPKLLGTFGDWSSYSYREDGHDVCYILSSPKKAVGAYKKRGEIFAMVTHRPSEKSNNVFSVMAGYSYKAGSSVNIAIDKEKFALLTHNDSAFAPDPATDERLTAAIQKGKSMVIKGTSSKGVETTDTYGLKGTSAALGAINKACGIGK